MNQEGKKIQKEIDKPESKNGFNFFYTNQQIIAIMKNVSVTEIHKFANGVYKLMKKQDYEVLSVKYYLDFFFTYSRMLNTLKTYF